MDIAYSTKTQQDIEQKWQEFHVLRLRQGIAAEVAEAMVNPERMRSLRVIAGIEYPGGETDDMRMLRNMLGAVR